MTDKQVNDADRKAAARVCGLFGDYHNAVMAKAGERDKEPYVEVFVQHRIQSTSELQEQLSQSNAEIERLRDTIILVKAMLAKSKGKPTSEGEAYNVLDSALSNTLATESQDG